MSTLKPSDHRPKPHADPQQRFDESIQEFSLPEVVEHHSGSPTSTLNEDYDRERFPRDYNRFSAHFLPHSMTGFEDPDVRMAAEATSALSHEPALNADDVEVLVEGAVATLVGTVPELEMLRLAENAVESVPGIIEVHDELQVIEYLPQDDESSGDPGGVTFRGPRTGFRWAEVY